MTAKRITPTDGDASLPLSAIIDAGSLDRRYWSSFAVLALILVLDYFDYFIVSFMMSELAPAWELTYGAVATILLGGGVGSIIGSLYGGLLADRFGRRPTLIWFNVVSGMSAATIAFLPDGAWVAFALLRIVSGVALGAITVCTIAYVVERTPGRHRDVVIGLNMVSTSVGTGLAALIAGILLEHFGWRGLALAGAAPLLLVVPIIVFLPESAPWLLATGRPERARRIAERQLGRPIPECAPEPTTRAGGPKPRMIELLQYPRRFWLVVLVCTGGATGLYGTYLWGPSILAMTQSISSAEAARLFVLASIAGISGKLFFAVLPHYTGRRRAGMISMGVGCISLACAAFTPTGTVAGLPTILLCFMGMAFFLEGGFSNILPYAAELFPVRLTGRGAGLGQAGVGVSKILGPLSLTLIAGSGDVVRPQATIDAIFPAFLFLSACAGVAFMALLLIPIETGRRPILGDESPPDIAGDPVPSGEPSTQARPNEPRGTRHG